MKVKLGEIYNITSGGTPSKKCNEYYDGGNIKWVKTGDLKEKYLFDTDEYITQEGLQSSSAKLYEPDTVLIAMYGATIGATSILKSEACTNQACAAFGKNDAIIPEYLYYFFKSKRTKFMKDGVGGAQPNISAGYLKNVQIELKSINEQRRIIDCLGKVEEIIWNEQKQIEQYDNLIKSRFVEMFGDPKLNPHEFPIHQLSEYISFLTSGSRGWAKYCADNGNAEAKRTRVQQGDLLISITADLGRTGVVTKEIAEHGAYINQHLTCIRFDQTVLNPLYVAYFMESEAGKEQFEAKNQSVVKAGLNFNSINSLKLIIPPIELQNQFSAFVHQVDKIKTVEQKRLEKLQLLFDSLMQKYFG